jgi:hypothetical membrane protein
VATEQAAPSVTTERYGPLVHRSVRHGAIVWLVATLQFIGGMIVTQIGYGSSYSLTQNYISDLGANTCGMYDGRNVCSPWHLVFNVSIVLFGLLLLLGIVLIRTGFPPRGTRTVGLGLLVLAAIGAIGVGLSPETYNITIHTISALLAFAGGGLALIVLGIAMFRDTRWDGFRAYSMLSGLVDLVALVLFATGTYGPLGVGGMERLIVAPVLLWAIVVSVHLVRIPTYAPPGVRESRA